VGIVVAGSIAFDNIMDFPGHFKDHILPDKVHILSVSFQVSNLKRMRGGAGANIAYNLALLGERPQLLGAVGDDFGDYRDWLESHGVDTAPVRVVPGEFTASAFITTDEDDNQITGFYPGAMAGSGSLSLHDVAGKPDLVIVSPDSPDAMSRYPGECREMGVPLVYSPGQQIVSLTAEQLRDGIVGARCLIGNDYEMEMIREKTGLTNGAILELADTVITTFGERGSSIATHDRTFGIDAVKPPRVADPTGAGDAYVAAVAYGLAHGEDPETFGRKAAALASAAVAEYGTQSHALPAVDA
jgi:adenosine kinase